MEGRKKEFLYAVAVFLQKFITAAVDVLWLVLLAELIGEAMPKNGVTGDISKMAHHVMSLILLSAWKRMGYSFGRSLTLKLQSMVRFRLNCQMVEKTAKVPYRLLEDQTFCELKQALQENINRGFVWFAVQKAGNFMMYCIRILGMSLLLSWAGFPLGLLFFLLEICHCLMTALGIEQENALVKKSSLEKQYMEELANQVLIIITYVLTEIGLAALLTDGRIDLGYFIALSVGVSGLIQKNEEGNALRYLQQEKLFIRQWNRFMNLPETEEKDEQKLCEDDHMVQEEVKTLEFCKVSFRYPRTGRYVLHDLSFKLTKGGYYAFVGMNGSGKTSIVKLLSGLYDNYEGEILLNGMELREIPFQKRRRIFAILFQDAARYEDTIVQNILPQEIQKVCTEKESGSNGDDERDLTAVKRRLAKELMREWAVGRNNRFPQGIDTFLDSMEDNGVMLSNGEWQQLLIAREMVQPAQIRVLDEPMASLDIFRQSRIYEQFTRDLERHTTLLFSHHMAAVSKAKQIFVLKEGTIVEEGSHEELMKKKGLYAKLFFSRGLLT